MVIEGDGFHPKPINACVETEQQNSCTSIYTNIS
jgi:hypothetical protein